MIPPPPPPGQPDKWHKHRPRVAIPGPKFNPKYVISQQGLFRAVEVISCVVILICNHVASQCGPGATPTCFLPKPTTLSIWPAELGPMPTVFLCVCPNGDVLTAFNFFTCLVLLSNLAFYGLYISSINLVYVNYEWLLTNVSHGAICSVLMFILSCISAGFTNDVDVTIIATSFGYFVSFVHTFHIIKSIVEREGGLDPSHRFPADYLERPVRWIPKSILARAQQEAESEGSFSPNAGHTADDVEACVLSSITIKTSSTLSLPDEVDGSKDDACSETNDDSSEDEGCHDFGGSDDNLVDESESEHENGSASEVSDKRSWIANSSLRDSDVTNCAVDNMSTGTYTVDLQSES